MSNFAGWTPAEQFGRLPLRGDSRERHRIWRIPCRPFRIIEDAYDGADRRRVAQIAAAAFDAFPGACGELINQSLTSFDISVSRDKRRCRSAIAQQSSLPAGKR